MLPPGAAAGASPGVLVIFKIYIFIYIYMVLTQARIDVQFHNQLHFKSYKPAPPAMMDTLLPEGPDTI